MISMSSSVTWRKHVLAPNLMVGRGELAIRWVIGKKSKCGETKNLNLEVKLNY